MVDRRSDLGVLGGDDVRVGVGGEDAGERALGSLVLAGGDEEARRLGEEGETGGEDDGPSEPAGAARAASASRSLTLVSSARQLGKGTHWMPMGMAYEPRSLRVLVWSTTTAAMRRPICDEGERARQRLVRRRATRATRESDAR